MKHNKKETPDTDRQLRELFQKELKPHQPSPWFTRRLMNRLPYRRKPILPVIEISIYCVALVATLLFGVIYGIATWRSGAIRIGDIVVIATAASMVIGLACMIISPSKQTEML